MTSDIHTDYAEFRNALKDVFNDIFEFDSETIEETVSDSQEVVEMKSDIVEGRVSAEGPAKTESAKPLDEIFKEVLTVCGSIAQSSPATTETVSKIKDLFKEINELKDMVEKNKCDLVEARVTDGPVAPMI